MALRYEIQCDRCWTVEQISDKEARDLYRPGWFQLVNRTTGTRVDLCSACGHRATTP